MDQDIVLFTPEGRETVLHRLQEARPEIKWRVGEHGFLKAGSDDVIPDASVLEILLKAATLQHILDWRDFPEGKKAIDQADADCMDCD